MPLYRFAFQSLCLVCVFLLLVVPISVELPRLLEVRCIHLGPLLLEALYQFYPALPLQLALRLH